MKIINEVKKFPGVLEANRVFGIYDILVRLSANSIDNPKELIKSRIKKIESIISTLTLVVTKERKDSLIPKIEIKYAYFGIRHYYFNMTFFELLALSFLNKKVDLVILSYLVIEPNKFSYCQSCLI